PPSPPPTAHSTHERGTGSWNRETATSPSGSAAATCSYASRAGNTWRGFPTSPIASSNSRTSFRHSCGTRPTGGGDRRALPLGSSGEGRGDGKRHIPVSGHVCLLWQVVA